MTVVQVVTHDKLVERRNKLKEKGLKAFLVYKKKRYALFRVQNFLNGGASPEKEHLEISKALEEETKTLGGTKQFAIVWDIDPLTNKVVRRDKSVWKAHDEFMEKAAVDLPMQQAK